MSETISIAHLDEDERLDFVQDAAWGSSELVEELGLEYVGRDEGEPRRWSRMILVVFKRVSDGKLFGIEYDEGLTEMQEDECCDTELREIEAREVTTVEYSYKK